MSNLIPLRTQIVPPFRRRVALNWHKALYWSGCASAYVRAAEVSGAVILAYHSVPTPELAACIDPRNAMALAVFERQMRFLKKHRRVLSMDDLLASLHEGRTIPRGSVVLTFDDGYLDNLLVVAPILKKHGLPAVLYLATRHIDETHPQCIDELYTAFTYRTAHELTWKEERFNLRRDNVNRIYGVITRELRGADYTARQRVLDEIRSQLRPKAKMPKTTLSWQQVRQLMAEYPDFSIGVHTAEHIDLGFRAEEAPEQIRRSVEDVRRETGMEPKHFSFPYGNSTQASRQCVASAGLSSAVVAGNDILIDGGCDPFALARAASSNSPSLLRFRTSGAYPGIAQLWRGRG